MVRKITWRQKDLIKELEEQLPIHSQYHNDLSNIDDLSLKEASKLIDSLLEGIHEEDDYGWDAHK